MNLTPITPEIKAVYQAAGRKRRKLIGFELWYGAERIGLFPTKDDAEAQVRRIAFELQVA